MCIRDSLHIAPLELQQGLRVFQGPLLGASPLGHAPLLQFGAGGPIHQNGQGYGYGLHDIGFLLMFFQFVLLSISQAG